MPREEITNLELSQAMDDMDDVISGCKLKFFSPVPWSWVPEKHHGFVSDAIGCILLLLFVDSSLVHEACFHST